MSLEPNHQSTLEKQLETLHYPPRSNVLTNSAMGRMRACERKYYLRNVAGLVPRGRSESLIRGSAFHEGIDQQDAEVAARYLRQSAAIRMPDGFIDEKQEEKAIIVEVMVKVALDKWGNWPDRREVPFRLPVVSPKGCPSRSYDMAGVLDGWPSDDPLSFWYDKAGEWKTTARLNSDYILGLKTRSQPMAYCWASSMILGRKIRTVVYRIAQTPGIRRRTKKQPETLAEFRSRLIQYYLDKPELLYEEHMTFTDTQIADWQSQMWEVSRRANDIRQGKRFPIMNDASCVSRWRCEYLDLCAQSVTEAAFDVVNDLHPELTAAMAAEGECNE